MVNKKHLIKRQDLWKVKLKRKMQSPWVVRVKFLKMRSKVYVTTQNANIGTKLKIIIGKKKIKYGVLKILKKKHNKMKLSQKTSIVAPLIKIELLINDPLEISGI